MAMLVYRSVPLKIGWANFIVQPVFFFWGDLLFSRRASEPRQKKLIFSMKYWLVNNRDPYILVS